MIELAKENFQLERTVANALANGPSPARKFPPDCCDDQSDGKNGEQLIIDNIRPDRRLRAGIDRTKK
ncbi:MAG: hypothetical protein FNP40_05690 [Dehalobacter sp. 4CP]|nr:hypothetical protein [Dehalobacter sp. 4CP]